MSDFTTQITCFKSLLHTVITSSFLFLPLSISRSKSCLHAGFVFFALSAHIYKVCRKFPPPFLHIRDLPFMHVPLANSLGLSPA